jgi:pSer/pThr/pTyr-binding forkhead associated (FHA) protein
MGYISWLTLLLHADSCLEKVRSMVSLTLRVIQGADRGKIYADLKPPITIGREEGNTIQLNDERVSRFHAKIQEDNSVLVLTDLESTNGTRVNGQECQLRILRYGDIVAVGRTVLLFGTREEIASRLQDNPTSSSELLSRLQDFENDLDIDLSGSMGTVLHHRSFESAVPGIPNKLSPSQLAQLSELLDYLHVRLGLVIEEVRIDEQSEDVSIKPGNWQILLNLYSRLAEMIRSLNEPDFTLPG